MSRAIHALVLAAALAASVTGVHGIAPLRDDAGSGGDAGDTPDEALPLPEAGTFQGNLSTPDDADWYSLPGDGSAVCVSATIDGRSVANATLAAERPGAELPPENTPSAEATHNPTESLEVGLASPDVERVLLGLTPQYTLTRPAAPDLALGGYTFDLELAAVAGTTADELAEDPDAGQGPGDVPDQGSSVEPPAVESSCTAGNLEAADGGSGDADAYRFHADAGDRVVVSLAAQEETSGATTMDLVTPAGKEQATLTNGDVVETTVEETGNYTLSLANGQGNQVEYGFGITTDDDGPPPCRPSCMKTGLS
jgi:hypothetical protein